MTIVRRWRVRVGWFATSFMLALTLTAIPGKASAEVDDARRLRSVTSRLVPYEIGGTTLEAIRALERLVASPRLRVASTARFLRAAASVDLATFSILRRDEMALEALAAVLNVDREDLFEAIQQSCREVRGGAFEEQMRSYGVVAGCLDSPTTEECVASLRRAADSRGGGATAARLLVLEPTIRAIDAARDAPAAEVTMALARTAGPMCNSATGPLVEICRAAAVNGADQAALARAVFDLAVTDLRALDTAAEGHDPLVTFAQHWIAERRDRLGWLALPLAIRAESLTHSQLPRATSANTSSPLELLIIDSRGASIAIAPVLLTQIGGSTRIDEVAAAPLPGRTVLARPFRFRAVIRPVPEVETELRELRERVDALIEAQGQRGPAWLQSEQRVLGLIMDRDLMMADVARFVLSAQRAGYRRFALFGRHADGHLAVLSASAGSVEDGPSPRDLPRVSVGPRDIRFLRGASASAEFERNDPTVGQAVATLLNGHSPSFAVYGTQPWMTYGTVFPTIDAVMAAAAPNVQQCMLLLPP